MLSQLALQSAPESDLLAPLFPLLDSHALGLRPEEATTLGFGVAVGAGVAVADGVGVGELFELIAEPTITSSNNKTTIPPKILVLVLIISPP